MESISIKLEDKFARDVEKMMREHHYTTKTEFIREAMRDKMKMLLAEENLHKFYGSSQRKTSDKEFHKAREKAFAELEAH